MIPLWQFGPQKVTPAERELLTSAATAGDFSVSDFSHPTRRRTANALARKGMLDLHAGRSAGWEPDMWSGTITCIGWNALWRAWPGGAGRHDPGCGGNWRPDGTCDGCRELRRLDPEAFDQYILATDEEERSFLINHTRLWCDEHGFARQDQWTTDKVCRQPGTNNHHGPFTRVTSG